LVSNHERRIRINQRDGSYTKNKVQTMSHLYAKRDNIFFLYEMFKEKNWLNVSIRLADAKTRRWLEKLFYAALTVIVVSK